MTSQKIIGLVRDIQPSQAQPTLELYFDGTDREGLPPGHRDEITLVLGDTTWKGTIGTKPGNDPYVHTFLHAQGERKPVTDVLLHMRLAEGARLRFAVQERGALELEEIIDYGAWKVARQPNAPDAGTGSDDFRPRL